MLLGGDGDGEDHRAAGVGERRHLRRERPVAPVDRLGLGQGEPQAVGGELHAPQGVPAVFVVDVDRAVHVRRARQPRVVDVPVGQVDALVLVGGTAGHEQRLTRPRTRQRARHGHDAVLVQELQQRLNRRCGEHLGEHHHVVLEPLVLLNGRALGVLGVAHRQLHPVLAGDAAQLVVDPVPVELRPGQQWAADDGQRSGLVDQVAERESLAVEAGRRLRHRRGCRRRLGRGRWGLGSRGRIVSCRGGCRLRRRRRGILTGRRRSGFGRWRRFGRRRSGFGRWRHGCCAVLTAACGGQQQDGGDERHPAGPRGQPPPQFEPAYGASLLHGHLLVAPRRMRGPDIAVRCPAAAATRPPIAGHPIQRPAVPPGSALPRRGATPRSGASARLSDSPHQPAAAARQPATARRGGSAATARRRRCPGAGTAGSAPAAGRTALR